MMHGVKMETCSPSVYFLFFLSWGVYQGSVKSQSYTCSVVFIGVLLLILYFKFERRTFTQFSSFTHHPSHCTVTKCLFYLYKKKRKDAMQCKRRFLKKMELVPDLEKVPELWWSPAPERSLSDEGKKWAEKTVKTVKCRSKTKFLAPCPIVKSRLYS